MEIILEHFDRVMRDPPPRTHDFPWEQLQLQMSDLSSLDSPFTAEEIWHAIRQMPQSKALGTDGFTGHFFRTCWQTIKADVIQAVNSFYDLRCQHLNLLNKANIILLPKKEGVESISNFRPISLIHTIAKIIT
jgi:hypothetical protein